MGGGVKGGVMAVSQPWGGTPTNDEGEEGGGGGWGRGANREKVDFDDKVIFVWRYMADLVSVHVSGKYLI